MVEHQTEDDRRRQLAVATVFAEKYNWELHEYESRFAVIDLYLTDKHRDQITGLCEVKCRPEYKHDEFDTIYVSFNKWYRLYLASVAFNVPGWIVFWYGADLYVRSLNVERVFTQPGCNLAIRGRTGRKNAANDLEPMILVPRTLLHTVATKVKVD